MRLMSNYLVIRQIGIQSFLLASVSSQCYYASQTEIIVTLFTKLLLSERVQSKDLQTKM